MAAFPPLNPDRPHPLDGKFYPDMTWPLLDDQPATLTEAVGVFVEESSKWAERAERAIQRGVERRDEPTVTMWATLSAMYAQQALIAMAMLQHDRTPI